MTVSKLATETWPLGKTPAGHNRFHRRPGRPQGFIVHHGALTSDDVLRAQFVAKSRELSANYAMRRNGDIVAVLHEEYRPFTSSSALADNWGITIEIANETAAPDWRISARAFDQLARLIADCATRWSFPINRSTVIGHREVRGRFGQGIATVCPGPWLYARLDELVALARRYQAAPTNPPPAPPAPPAPPTEEDELMGAIDEVRKLTDDVKEAVRRESRPRLIERALTGELQLVRAETGYRRPLTRAQAEAIMDGPQQLLTRQELERHPVVDEATWAAIQDDIDAQLERIAAAVVAAFTGSNA